VPSLANAEAGGCEGLADVVASCFATSARYGKQTTTDIHPHTCSCCLQPVATQLKTVRIRLFVLPRSSWQLAPACCGHSQRCTSGTFHDNTHAHAAADTPVATSPSIAVHTCHAAAAGAHRAAHQLPAAVARIAAGAGSTPQTTASPSHARGSPKHMQCGHRPCKPGALLHVAPAPAPALHLTT
jgi:hypothetical protein